MPHGNQESRGNRPPPLRIGVAGLGGFAGVITNLLLTELGSEAAPMRLVAVCEPEQAERADTIAHLRQRAVEVYSSFAELLASPVEAVWLPLPIQYHRAFTEQALEAGKAVLCEKPVAGAVDDVDALLAARDRAGLPVAVGFQDIYEPATLALKRRLLQGAIGELRSATVVGLWPRDDAYYARAPWAGRRQVNGVWVMDSPASNALSHYLMLALFFLGAEVFEAAEPVLVQAELYRARAIETYDTCALRVSTAGAAPILALLTHACQRQSSPRIEIHGSRGSLIYVANDHAELRAPQGAETFPLPASALAAEARAFAALARGAPHQGAVATLEMARAHLVAVNGASEATPVQPIPPERVILAPSRGGAGGYVRAIEGIEELFDACARERALPQELGLASWTVAGGSRALRGYSHFAGPREGGA